MPIIQDKERRWLYNMGIRLEYSAIPVTAKAQVNKKRESASFRHKGRSVGYTEKARNIFGLNIRFNDTERNNTEHRYMIQKTRGS